MLDYLGTHYDILAGGALAIYTLVLAATSLEDALRRRREPHRSLVAAPDMALGERVAG